MEGAGAVVEELAAYLKGALPGKLEALRARKTMDVKDCPNPRQVLDREPETDALDLLPAVYITEQNTVLDAVEKLEDNSGNVYRTQNAVNVFCVIAGRTYQGATKARQTYALAVMELLLEHPAFAPNMRTIAKGMRTEYSDVDRNRNNTALVGMCRTRIRVDATETLLHRQQPEGTVPHLTQITTELLPIQIGP